MSFRLKNGGTYRTRRGAVVTVKFTPRGNSFHYKGDNGISYDIDGRELMLSESENDLVAEWQEDYKPPRMAELQGFDFVNQPWAIPLSDMAEFDLIAAMLIHKNTGIRINFPTSIDREIGAKESSYMSNCYCNGRLYPSGIYLVTRGTIDPSVTIIKPTFGDVVVAGVTSLTIEPRETENERKKREILEQIAVLQKQAEEL